MTDREKAIKAIEICYTIGHNCTECPLFSEDECNDKLMRDVLALLKEQETTYAYNEYTNPACTSCGFRPFAGYIPTLKWMQERGYRYCPGCGKAVKWDGQ